VASTTLLKNATMTLMSFDGGRPLDVGISKRLITFDNGFAYKTNFVKTMKNLDLPHEKTNIGALDGVDYVVLGLLYMICF